MILFLSTGFSISTLPFTNSKCAGGAFGFNYFQSVGKRDAKPSSPVQFFACVKDRSSAFHYEDDNKLRCVNTQQEEPAEQVKA